MNNNIPFPRYRLNDEQELTEINRHGYPLCEYQILIKSENPVLAAELLKSFHEEGEEEGAILQRDVFTPTFVVYPLTNKNDI